MVMRRWLRSCSFALRLMNRWAALEREGNAVELTAWMPALVGLLVGLAVHELPLEAELDRLARWRDMGARLGGAHIVATEYTPPPFQKGAGSKERLLSALDSIRLAEALEDGLPKMPAVGRRHRM